MVRNKIINVASVPQRSPFRYPGGKTWLIPKLRKWIYSLPSKPAVFVEPFAGGAIASLTVAFENLADSVIIIELDPEVCAVWKVITGKNYKHLSKRILEFEVNRENVVEILNAESNDPLDSAFKTIVKNRMQHGGILAPGASLMKNGEKGKGLKSRWYPETLAKRINAIGEIRKKIKVIKSDGIKEITKHSDDLNTIFFIDPPYTAGGKKAGKRLYRYNELDHEKLFAVCNQVKGDFLMTYDNAADVHELASTNNFDVEPVSMKSRHHEEMTELLVGYNLEWSRITPAEQLELKF